MCSASQDDLRDHYGPREASTFMLPDTAAWQPDESTFNPSKQPEGLFDEPYPWAEDDEKEEVLRDEFYLSDPSHNVSEPRPAINMLRHCKKKPVSHTSGRTQQLTSTSLVQPKYRSPTRSHRREYDGAT